MKQKAFTLAELLAIIVIISILLLLIVPGIINRISNSRNEATETENQIIYDAADQYIREKPSEYPPGKSGRYCIPIQSLVDDGKLVAPVADVNTGKDITNLSVMVTIYSTGNTDHELKEGEECEEIAALPMIDFKVEPNGSSWVKQRKVTIIYPSIEGNYEASHRIDNGSWIRDSSADNGGNIELIFTKIGQLEARLKSKNIITSKIDIVNVDSQEPVITKVAMGSWSNGNNNIQITARDDISGLNGLYISTSNTKPTETASGWISISSDPGKSKTFTRNLDLGTYYIWVKDKAGNISSSNTSLEVKDTIKPTCTIADSGTKGDNNWYRGNVALKMTTSDKESGVASYGMNTSNSATYNGTTQMTLTYDSKSVTYYGFVKDRAGNIGTCSKTVKRDTVAPSCSLKTSGTIGNNDWYKSNVTVSFASKTDSTSTVSNYGITTSTSASYNSKNNVTQINDTSNITYYGYVKDEAGNTNRCSTNFKKDSTKPVLSYTLKKADGGAYSSGDLSDQDVVRTLSPTDNLSEIDHTERNTGSGWTLEEKLDKYTYTSSNNSSFRTVDKAGNVSDEIKLNIRIEKDPDKNMSAKCNIVCGPNGRNCYVYGQNYGASWQWTFTGAGSGINPWSMYIDYSTEWVTSYCQLYYPTNKNYCGNAEWGSNWILFGRSYARSHITGTACSYKGKCKSCTVY